MSAQLSPATVLERASDFTLVVQSAGDAIATVEGVSAAVGAHALELLAAFREPRKLGEVLAQFDVKGRRDFVDLYAAIRELVAVGLLRPAGTAQQAPDLRGQWADARTHVAMLDDVVRTRAFISAIQRTVTPDDVVLDIGTGTGVLAVAAAKAGARRVFAVEASQMATVAAELCAENGVEDRVEVIRGWSSRISLPEPATVLVSETLGSDPLEEHIIALVRDAQARLLVPGARLIPSALRIMAVPVEVPAALLDRLMFTQANCARWSQALDLDFATLATSAGWGRSSLSDADARMLVPLGPAVELWHIDLLALPTLHTGVAHAAVEHAGTLSGVHVYFEAALADDLTLSTRPGPDLPASHWQTTLWRGAQREVRAGASIQLSFASDGSKITLGSIA